MLFGGVLGLGLDCCRLLFELLGEFLSHSVKYEVDGVLLPYLFCDGVVRLVLPVSLNLEVCDGFNDNMQHCIVVHVGL